MASINKLAASLLPENGSIICEAVWGGSCRRLVHPPTWSHADHPTYDQILSRIADPDCPSVLLESLYNNNDLPPAERDRIVLHRNAPATVLTAAAIHSEDPAILNDIAKRPDSTPETLSAVYNNERTPKDTRLIVLQHPHVSNRLLLSIYTADKDPLASPELLAVLSSPNCPVEWLREHATDAGSGLKAAVASNPMCPSDILEKLLEQNDYGFHNTVLTAILSNPACPITALEKYSASNDPDLRVAVATNPRLPADLFSSMALDDDRGVCQALSANPACPPTIRSVILLSQ